MIKYHAPFTSTRSPIHVDCKPHMKVMAHIFKLIVDTEKERMNCREV